MLHVYALVRRPATLPDTAGIAGARLRVVQVTETLDDVASETQAGGSAATEEAILAHARVVEQLAATAAAVLPMRFGGAVADDDELRRRLAPREQELAAALERVSGCVELGLRVLAAQRDAAPAASGREYME